jgi:phosphoglycerate dehydrogenase-like enzyme
MLRVFALKHLGGEHMPKIVSLVPKFRFETSRVALPPTWEFCFLESVSDDEIIAACQGADCLLVLAVGVSINEWILANIPDIKLIQTIGAGYDSIDIMAAALQGIPVANAPGENTNSVAEYTIGVITALQRKILISDREIKAGNYGALRRSLLGNGVQEIGDSRLGLIGLGAIARQVSRIAKVLGASVSYFSAHQASAEIEKELDVEFKPLDMLLSTSDIVSIHVPLKEETRGLIGRRELALMPSGGLIINTARGEVVDQWGLAESLESGYLAGAAIDTLYPEPPGIDHPLCNLSPMARDRLLLTPHIAGATTSASKRMLNASLKNIERLLNGEELKHVVNDVSRRIRVENNITLS